MEAKKEKFGSQAFIRDLDLIARCNIEDVRAGTKNGAIELSLSNCHFLERHKVYSCKVPIFAVNLNRIIGSEMIKNAIVK